MSDESPDPKPIRKFRGRVTRGLYARGTKSEREAVFLEAGDERYLLRRKTGPAFADRELDRYVGHTIECDGFIVDHTLLAEQIRLTG